MPADHPDKGKEGGSQSTPGEFIDWLLDVAEACDRVLAPHGSLCIELGDTYAGSNSSGVPFDPGRFEFEGDARDAGETPGGYAVDTNEKYERIRGKGFKRGVPNLDYKQQGGGTGWPLAKSLSLIPESFRWAMVYGRNPFTGRTTEPWRLRNVIRWVRPNPPVGALGDKFRPATSELMVFCKSAKRYFDLDSVRTPFVAGENGGGSGHTDDGTGEPGGTRRMPERMMTHSGAPPLDWWNIPLLEGEEETRYGPTVETPKPRTLNPKQMAARQAGVVRGAMAESTYHKDGGAPPLDWWEIPPGGYEGAHYAVFPPELCVKPVKAMCPEKVCRVCGEPSRRIVEVGYQPDHSGGGSGHTDNGTGDKVGSRRLPVRLAVDSQTIGFSDCGHDDWRPGMVLDCFGGSGTTALVATGHGRDCILIDLDERNFELALERVGPFILTLGETEARPS